MPTDPILQALLVVAVVTTAALIARGQRRTRLDVAVALATAGSSGSSSDRATSADPGPRADATGARADPTARRWATPFLADAAALREATWRRIESLGLLDGTAPGAEASDGGSATVDPRARLRRDTGLMLAGIGIVLVLFGVAVAAVGGRVTGTSAS